MRVLCIESSNCNDPRAILVTEGSYYHIVNIKRKSVCREGTNNFIWYQLLETGINAHHSSLFAVVEDEEIEDTIQLKINVL